MNEPGIAGPIVFRQWLRHSYVEFEVGIFRLNLAEVLLIEDFFARTRTIPIGHLPFRALGVKEVEDV